jgi:cob(I)alamin adenosyltransferase
VVTRAPDEFTSAVATRKGDDGTTGLLYGGARIPKDDLRTEAYGTIDETVAALGLARAQLGLKDSLGVLSVEFGDLPDLILRIQRELFVAGAELATNPDAWDRLEDGRTRVSA